MNIFSTSRPVVLALALFLAADISVSAETSKGNWYVGGGVGISKVNSLCSRGTFSGCEDTGGSMRLFGGLQLNPNFALEATLDLNGDYLSPGSTAAGYDGSTGAYFLGLNAIGFIPVAERVALYGGASGAFSYVTTDVTERRYHNGTYSTCYYDGYSDYYGWYYYCVDNNDRDRSYRSDTSVAAGALLGVDVKVAERVHVRAQAQRYFNVKGDLAFGGHRDIDQFTVNGLFMFR
ncbi:MAG: outer membrane beta-barrel protein [Steroidobacteraceae bacterium]